MSKKALIQEIKRYARAENELKNIEENMENKIQNIKSKYREKIKKWLYVHAGASERLQTAAFYYYTNLFAEEKSIDLQHGCIGFRKGRYKVVKIGHKSWEEVSEACEKVAPEFVRLKKELNKDKILAAKDQPQVLSDLKKIGISVLQDEYFYIHIYKD